MNRTPVVETEGLRSLETKIVRSKVWVWTRSYSRVEEKEPRTGKTSGSEKLGYQVNFWVNNNISRKYGRLT